ncbi:VOC family protein [Deinococcus hopiensis]|uniref:Glyoxalase-like domain-containing protein n=1 Tax=Deinococcus hopiensis KR-140 TaxID=695939 RepID=A0A1W1VIZ4_9DEIO|nr:VOC family protein [Deinococcus hopiensis]SMB93298.1 Glyoxalase-like domain-containing protein [Deinococcus hopiensis KR-140]
MSVQFNHAIIAAHDRHASASFFAQLFGLSEPTFWGPFASVTLEEGVHLQFAEPGIPEIQMQHFAFLVDDPTFDQIYERMQLSGLEHWADPQGTLPGQINTHHGGRGVYFKDPAGHGFEIITRPYGSSV